MPSSRTDSPPVGVDRATAEAYARWFQALSDPTRIVILSYLSRCAGPVSVGTIVADLDMGSQPSRIT